MLFSTRQLQYICIKMFRQKSVCISVQKLWGDDVFALCGVRCSAELLVQALHYTIKAHPATSPQNFLGNFGARRYPWWSVRVRHSHAHSLMEYSLLRGTFPLRAHTRLPLALIGAARERIKSRIICCSLGIAHLFPLGVVVRRLGFASFTEMIPFKAAK